MSKAQDIRVGGKTYAGIVDTAKRYDKDKEKPVVTNSLVDGQRRKLESLMTRIDKPINIPGQVFDSILWFHLRFFDMSHIRGRPLFVQATFSYNFAVHERVFF